MKRLVITILQIIALLVFVLGLLATEGCSDYPQQPMTPEGRQILMQGLQMQEAANQNLFRMNMEMVRTPPWRP
jgi:hypothetical protein